VQAGDVIVGIGGQPVTGQADFYARLWARGSAGVEVPLEVLRKGRIQGISVRSMDRDAYYRPRTTY
jgi:S1-C subfamily serine protease